MKNILGILAIVMRVIYLGAVVASLVGAVIFALSGNYLVSIYLLIGVLIFGMTELMTEIKKQRIIKINSRDLVAMLELVVHVLTKDGKDTTTHKSESTETKRTPVQKVKKENRGVSKTGPGTSGTTSRGSSKIRSVADNK